MTSPTAPAAVQCVRHGAILVATLHNPPVNAINAAVRRGLLQAAGLWSTYPRAPSPTKENHR